MHINPFNEMTDLGILSEHIKTHSLGTWSCLCDGEIVVNHIPFLYFPERGQWGTLVGHVARNNPVWRTFSRRQNSVVVFQGPQAYVSPSWYPSKDLEGKAVPTWNYTVVHAHGIPVLQEDPQWLLRHLIELTTVHESAQVSPWSVADAPSQFIERLMAAIVGIEIPLVKITAKWKLGQNKPLADQQGMITGLLKSDNHQAHDLAELIKKQILVET